MADLLLSYSYLTEPRILQAGNDATLTIIVSNAGAPFTLKGIDFVLTQGTGARDLYNGVTPTTPSLPDGWSHPSPTGGKFAMSPPAPYTIGREGLVFVFKLTVSVKVGTAIIDITEHVEVDGAQRANRGTLSVPKFPQSFTLDGFYSAKPIVNQGDNLTLVWVGQNLHLANYSVSYSVNGQTKVIDIPAHTYTYTVDALGASSVFYLHATAAEASDTSFIFQSSEYPITVNPAIQEFRATSSVGSPSSSVTLSWRVSDSVTSATIGCPQTGQTWPLDASGLQAGQLAIDLPAISMSAQYVFQAFHLGQDDAQPALVASKTVTIAVTANIPSLQSGYAQFVTDAQADDLAKMEARPRSDTVVPRLMKDIFSAFKTAHPEVDFYLDWSKDTPNARSFVYIDGRKKVVIFGGLVRIACLYYEAFCFIVAQCVGRLSGEQPVDGNSLTYVGVADYDATATILGRVFYAISANSDLVDGVADQMKTLFLTGISPQNQAADPGNPAANPGIQCRYNALTSGIFNSNMPSCVTGSASS